ncbi:MAG TPA: oxidoreductase [Streptosporangiaceae bacterium]|jgi:NAD(P)-dependent dehydrogenase (short-subunit alcohol dehydrogenase family)
MDLHLSGKTAVVTGASRGIGLAVTRTLVAEGMRVVGAARTITTELEETGAIPVSADLSTAEGVGRLVDEASVIDVLVNNVGGGDDVDLGGFLSLDDAHWRENFDVNFYSALRVTRAALPSLIDRRGAIVNVSSAGARVPSGGPVAYNVAKAALTALSKALAEEFGPRGVRVNTVSPGPVRTSIWESADGFGGKLAANAGVDLPDFLEQVPEMMGMTTGRIAEPEEVAALIAYLASDRARSVCGADYAINGGLIKTA